MDFRNNQTDTTGGRGGERRKGEKKAPNSANIKVQILEIF